MVRLSAVAAAALLAVATTCANAADRAVTPANLAAALRNAKPGDTLELAPGVYRGPLVISTRVALRGGPGVVIDGGGSGNALTLAADGIGIYDVTVRNSGRDLSHDDAAILLREAHGATVERCRVEARGFGIYIRAGGGNRIANNQVRGDASLPRSQRGNGIHLWHTERNELVGNVVTDARDGMYFSFAHRNLIRGNRTTRVRYGIHYMYSDHNRLVGNRLERCTGGVALMFTSDNLVEKNVSVDNRAFGILCLDVDRTHLDGNLIARNGRGFFVEDSSRNHFTRNRLVDNGVGAFVTAGSEANLFTRNDFDGNLVQAYVEYAGINAWAEHGRGNRWSDYLGFDFNGDGVGDLPYRLQTAASALLARRPAARWFMMSPALALLDWWDAQIVDRHGVSLDPAPLVAAGEGRRSP